MFKQWLKQFLAMLLCVITILSSISPAYADNYVISDSGDEATYYIIEGKDVQKLFDFSVWDVKDLAKWMFQFRTYTVIKKYEDVSGTTQYKMYYNAPNLQSLAKHKVISIVDDGYSGSTYKVEDTEWVVKVGQNATSENVITKYGFNIPSFTYAGEYPKAVMSTANILPNPKKWWQVAWRAIKSLFDVSFIAAPDADNFNTISYLNHTYLDRNDYIVRFFQKYYLDYFERQIPLDYVAANDPEKAGEYFSGPEEVIDMAVTEDAYDAACRYNEAHEDEYKDAVQRYKFWDAYEEGGIEACLELDELVGNRKYDSWHFIASIEKYKEHFNTWANANPNAIYIMLNAIVGSHNRYGGSGMILTKHKRYGSYVDRYEENLEFDTSISLAADIVRFTAESDNFKANITYKVQTRTYDETTDTYGEWVDAPESSPGEEGEDVIFKETEEWRDWSDETTEYYDYGDADEDTATTRKVDFTINYLFSKNDKDNIMSYYETYKDFVANCDFTDEEFSMVFDISDFVPPILQGIYEAYLANEELKEKYLKFCEMLARGDDQPDATNKKELLYRQCMITNESEDEDDCWSRKYSDDKTSLSVVQVYAYSRIYTTTQDIPSSVHELTAEQAIDIISKLQAYCGTYSNEVISNMMKIMCATAKNEGVSDPTKTIIADDPRVMPYDTDSLLARDRENYNLSDYRTDLYKSHVIGGVISKFRLDTFSISAFFKPQSAIINVAGKVTELSVFMQQLCNFDILDSYGLSPVTMWTSGYVLLLMSLIALFFILKTMMTIVKNSKSAGRQILVSFVILFIELGIFTSIAANPSGTWNMIKNAENKIINIGEMATVYNISGLEYLYGNTTNMEVTYYMPYLDIWSKYNTGHGMLANEQKIDATRDYRELKEKDFPEIGGTEVKHWSILLADAFHFWGKSTSISNSYIDPVTHKVYNGNAINNNAYRVVDHFLAPRTNVSDNGSTITLSFSENENFNDAFQKGVVDLIAKLLNCVLCCLLSLIKLLTFLWQWFVIYIFIFRVILGRGAEGKPMSVILIETFSPTLALILIGTYSGMVMTIGMTAEGLLGIFLEIFLFILTFIILRWWHDLGHQICFPKTLIWLYVLSNMSKSRSRRRAEKAQNKAKQQDIENEMDEDYSDKTLEEQQEELFDENGNIRDKYKDSKYDDQVINWYNRAKAQEKNYNVQHSPETLRQMRNLENSERFSQYMTKDGNMYKAKENKSKSNSNSTDNTDNSTANTDNTKAEKTSRFKKNKDKNKEKKNSNKAKAKKLDEQELLDDYGRKSSGSGREKRKRQSKIGQSDD